MAHDVFISYSSKDKTVADAVCANLENQGIRCWIAPRDVPPGQSWAASIIGAITESKVFVLVFSDGSNKSNQVVREVGEAVDHGIPIVPLRIEDVEPSQEMRYYIKSIHWLDAMTPPLEQHLQKLSHSVQALLSVETSEVLPKLILPLEEAPAKKRWPLPTWATALLILVAVVIVGGGVWAISRSGSKSSGIDPTEVVSPTEMVSPTEAVSVIATEESSTQDQVDDWHPLSFMIPNPQLWNVSGEERYTAVKQSEFNAFAWSSESFEGDLTLSFDLESPVSQSEGCVIIYGAGHEYTFGSLIFCVESAFYQLEKHTRFHEGENFLIFSPSNLDFKGQVYSVTIEIIGDVASMFVNGQKVLSTFFDTEEISRSGRIGLHRVWAGPEITFSNIKIKTPPEEEQTSSTPDIEEFDCELDTGAQQVFYLLNSPYNSPSIEVDGKISSSEEWSRATCVDLRMHYSVNYINPNFQRIRWWVQNNEQDISFLVRIPKELGLVGVFADYFWPEYSGGWPNSDGAYAEIDGEVFDHAQWDDLQWYEDVKLDPPGTMDVEAGSSEDDEFYWIELKRPLDSGDVYDWAFNPGQTYGDNPRDAVLFGLVLEEGMFMRNIQLGVGEP